ncbi:MAG: hypothetical protein IBX56_20150 [Methylomicrobium sp.]|nr:hypothetical protein [Methylomicrobium sp.]
MSVELPTDDLTAERLVHIINQHMMESFSGETLSVFQVSASSNFSVLTEHGWRTKPFISGRNLYFSGMRVGARDNVICVFATSGNDAVYGDRGVGIVEMPLDKAEECLPDFKEWMLIEVDIECYLSEYISLYCKKEMKVDENIKMQTEVEKKIRRSGNKIWGSW